MNRIIRDMLILIAFCSAFYLLTLFVGAEGNFSGSRSNFSRDRLLADASLEKGDWETASHHYQKLLEDDPFNELAMLRKSHADVEWTEERVKEFKRAKHRAAGDKATRKRLNDQIAQTVAESIASQQILFDSVRFRQIAMRHLVILNCIGGNRQAALDALNQYASLEIRPSRNPLSVDPRLRMLRNEPDFIRFYNRERNAVSFYR